MLHDVTLWSVNPSIDIIHKWSASNEVKNMRFVQIDNALALLEQVQ